MYVVLVSFVMILVLIINVLLSFDLYANSRLVFPRTEWRGEVVGVVITTWKWEGTREIATRTTEGQA